MCCHDTIPVVLTRLDRTNNATIEVIIEAHKFNNSLAGYLNCPNSDKSRPGSLASDIWINTYLQDGMYNSS
jgi:hypothetical protein